VRGGGGGGNPLYYFGERRRKRFGEQKRNRKDQVGVPDLKEKGKLQSQKTPEPWCVQGGELSSQGHFSGKENLSYL